MFQQDKTQAKYSVVHPCNSDTFYTWKNNISNLNPRGANTSHSNSHTDDR